MSDCAGRAADTMTRRWPATYPSRTTRTVCSPFATSRTVTGVSPTSCPSRTTRAPAGVELMRIRPAAAGGAAACAPGRRLGGDRRQRRVGTWRDWVRCRCRRWFANGAFTELANGALAGRLRGGCRRCGSRARGFRPALPARHLVTSREPERHPQDKREPQRPHGGPRGGERAVDVFEGRTIRL